MPDNPLMYRSRLSSSSAQYRSCTQPRPTDHNFRASSQLVLMLLLNVRQLDAVVPTDCIFITVNQSLEKSNCKEQLKKKIMLVWIHRWPHSKY
ncbi:hypothetical protein V6N13_092010 [Hibiscus sabdariffa]